MKTQYIFGDYVLTAIPNVFNNKTGWWLSKKDCAVARYCFSTNTPRPAQIHIASVDENDLKAIIARHGEKFDIQVWDTADDRNDGIAYHIKAGVDLEKALEIFGEEYECYACMEIHDEDGIAICIGGHDDDVRSPEWLTPVMTGGNKAIEAEVKRHVDAIDGYIKMFDATIGKLN